MGDRVFQRLRRRVERLPQAQNLRARTAVVDANAGPTPSGAVGLARELVPAARKPGDRGTDAGRAACPGTGGPGGPRAGGSAPLAFWRKRTRGAPRRRL